MHKEINTRHASAYIGWRWRTFSVGVGGMVAGDLYLWLELGFLYVGLDIL